LATFLDEDITHAAKHAQRREKSTVTVLEALAILEGAVALATAGGK
jgi:hypothetical protein